MSRPKRERRGKTQQDTPAPASPSAPQRLAGLPPEVDEPEEREDEIPGGPHVAIEAQLGETVELVSEGDPGGSFSGPLFDGEAASSPDPPPIIIEGPGLQAPLAPSRPPAPARPPLVRCRARTTVALVAVTDERGNPLSRVRAGAVCLVREDVYQGAAKHLELL